ncbi:MAG: hypothetical protein ABSA54_04130 [Terriglobales bacterium]|jgi:hypothetical protein
MAPSKSYFREKGQRAEAIIHNLATRTFLTDWCYPNPKKLDGKELCDLLVVFDDIAIIWQIKDLKVDEAGLYKAAEVEKNLRQLSGAQRHMFDLKVPIELENPRRGKELFNPEKIRAVHLVSVLMGEGEGPFPFMQTTKDRLVHVFTREFSDTLLSELDTVSDFCEYLRKKEAIEKNKMIFVLGGEENLLAKYLEHGRSFSWMDNYDNVVIDDTVWPAFSANPQFLAKKRENEISYGWDSIIDRAHDGSSAEYERAARELARPDRFSRRLLSKSFMEAYKQYLDSPLPIFRRMMPLGDTTYCFLFMEDGNQLPRKRRTAMLQCMCFVARGLPPMNKRVIGIATERENRSYDYCVRIQPQWRAEDETTKIQIQKGTGIFVRPRLMVVGEDEYPNVR